MKRIGNFIGGEFCDAAGGGWIPYHPPLTGESAAEIADSDILDLARAVQSANAAGAAWLKLEPRRAGQMLAAVAERIEAWQDLFAKIQSCETGTPFDYFLGRSVPAAAQFFRREAERLSKIETGQSRGVEVLETPPKSGGARAVRQRLPIGIAAIVVPWSDSLLALASRVAPALAAGNVVIAKASEFAPQTAEHFCEILREAGLPSGVFNLLQGRGEQIGRAIVEHPGLSHVSFMGRTENGIDVQKRAAEFFKKTQLALGARNPVLVFQDADLKRRMSDIVALTMGTGVRTCLRGSRLFVQEAIYKNFLAAYRDAVASLRIGDPSTPGTNVVGPLATEKIRRDFLAAVSLAAKENAKILVGGDGLPEGLEDSLRNGFFVKPTAFQDLTMCSTLQQEEIIGPFVTISSFKYQHEAVKQANTSPMGQAAYVFHEDSEKAMSIGARLQAGRVFVNWSSATGDMGFDFEPLKNSGAGMDGESATFDFFTHRTTILYKQQL